MIRRSAFLTVFILMLVIVWAPAAGAAPTQAGPFVMNFRSQGSRDGDLLESTETSNTANASCSICSEFLLGDYDGDRQYRAVLHFNTSGLPDNATVTKAVLKIKTNGYSGTDPFSTNGYVIVEIRRGFFGSSVNLEFADFQAAAHTASGRIYNTPVSGWYSSSLNAASLPYVNRIGNTQFRLRFQIGDNDNGLTDVRGFFPGDYAIVSDRPLLRVWYTTP